MNKNEQKKQDEARLLREFGRCLLGMNGIHNGYDGDYYSELMETRRRIAECKAAKKTSNR